MGKKIKVLLTGGGTGGHIYPALAIAQGIKAKYPQTEFFYIGTKRGLEADIVTKAGIKFKAITAEGLTRKISWPAARTALKTFRGFSEAAMIIRKFKPHVVVGTGGYVCGPVIMAAHFLHIPTIIHEQNAFPGLTNKLLARFVDRICYTFPECTRFFKTKASLYHTGLPIRREIIETSREQGAKKLQMDPNKINILVVGGSQGAQKINETIFKLYPFFKETPTVNLLHLTGKKGYEQLLGEAKQQGIKLDDYDNITIRPYIYDMENALAAADFVISRSGASFLAEVMAKGLPSILIPYPYASENHQEHNARALEKKGAAIVILEKELNEKILLQNILDLIVGKEKRSAMSKASFSLGKPDALEEITTLILELTGS
ncbi:undecaprenyldiphospho-muramoylpentapeptide beta-N-acetylglucosaminyltransferase [Bacillota bacterium LX-D]|nr:undecaprenyldiphospho-muramoylpentapeptide beta-N-acetylglucosaminyltransferase [Bacillota bacterium LX-D]